MEADWSVEIGADLPSIFVPWREADTGLKFPELRFPALEFTDLRAYPLAVSELSEVRKYPALGAALSVLNAAQSQVFTSKCDAWPVAGDDMAALNAINRDEVLADNRFAIAAYIDVLLREAVDFASFELHENWLRRLTTELRATPIPAAVVELTLRWAQVEDNEGFGTTIHVTGCGGDEASALWTWEAALAAVSELVARGVAPQDLPTQASQKSGN